MSVHLPLDLRASVLAGRAADVLRARSRVEASRSTTLAITVGGVDAEIPAAALEVLVDALEAMSVGQDVVAAPADLEVGTTEASRLLGVSRTWVASLMDRGELEGRRNGTKRRIALRSVLDMARRDREAVKSTFDDNQAQDEASESDDSIRPQVHPTPWVRVDSAMLGESVGPAFEPNGGSSDDLNSTSDDLSLAA